MRIKSTLYTILSFIGIALVATFGLIGGGFMLPVMVVALTSAAIVLLLPVTLLFMFLDRINKSKIQMTLDDYGFDRVDNLIQLGQTSGAELANVNFTGHIFSSHKIRDSNLKSARFSGANCSNMDFSHCGMEDADMKNTNLRGASFTSSIISRGNFEGADLTQAEMDRTYLARSNFQGARLNSSDLSETIMTKADVSDCSAKRAIFDRVKAIGAKFARSNFQGASFKGARLQHSSMVGANFKNADLSEANLCGALMKSTNLDQANLYGAKFNHRTVLPISKNEALERGMVYAS